VSARPDQLQRLYAPVAANRKPEACGDLAGQDSFYPIARHVGFIDLAHLSSHARHELALNLLKTEGVGLAAITAPSGGLRRFLRIARSRARTRILRWRR